MTSRDFCYWLQGFFEIETAGTKKAKVHLDIGKVDAIKNHLALVFLHDIDPSQHKSAAEAAAMQAVHDGKPLKLGGVDPKTGAVMRC